MEFLNKLGNLNIRGSSPYNGQDFDLAVVNKPSINCIESAKQDIRDGKFLKARIKLLATAIFVVPFFCIVSTIAAVAELTFKGIVNIFGPRKKTSFCNGVRQILLNIPCTVISEPFLAYSTILNFIFLSFTATDKILQKILTKVDEIVDELVKAPV